MARNKAVWQAENAVISREINYALRLSPEAWENLLQARRHLAKVQAQAQVEGEAARAGERSS